MNPLKKKVKEYLVERGWEILNPADVAKSIVIESAELLEIFQWDNTRPKKKMDTERLEKVKEELADVIIYCLDMAVVLDLDVDKIVDAKLEKVKKKYPAHLFKKGNARDKKTSDLYSKIKQEHRKRKI